MVRTPTVLLSIALLLAATSMEAPAGEAAPPLQFGPKASYAIALHLAKSGQWEKYFAFSLHSTEQENFKELVAERGDVFYEMYETRTLPRVVAVYSQIRDKSPIVLSIDKTECAVFILDRPVSSTRAIAMYKDGDHFAFRKSSYLNDGQLRKLREEHSPLAAVDEKDCAQLCRRFLTSLANENLEECMACWVSVPRIKQFLQDPPDGMPIPPPEQHGKMVEYFRQRDKVIEEHFPKLVKALKDNGAEPKDLTYVSSYGRPEIEAGVKLDTRVTTVKMVFRCQDETLVKISIDDGMKLDGKWYFSDKPFLHITFTKQESRTVGY